jgi:hypothetical protein
LHRTFVIMHVDGWRSLVMGNMNEATYKCNCKKFYYLSFVDYFPCYFIYKERNTFWHTPKFLDRFKCDSKVTTTEESRVGAHSLAHNNFGGKRACWSSGMGLGRMINIYSFTRTCTKPNNKLVSALLEHFWC